MPVTSTISDIGSNVIKRWLSKLSFLGLAASLGACTGITSDIGGGIASESGTTTESLRQPIEPQDVSPFDEFRNILWSLDMDEDSRRRRFDADRIHEENIIAQCMNELGFEYIPFVDNWILSFGNSDSWHPDDPDWVATYGYGWVSSPPGGRGGAWLTLDARNPDSPNQQILAELSDTERSAWISAWSGRGAGFEREVNGTIFSDCNNWARAVVAADHEIFANSEEFAPLMEAISGMQDDLRWDISDADRTWSTCMFDAGFPGFDRQRDASDTIAQEWAEMMTAISADPDWYKGIPSPANSPQMAALHDREVNLASADLSCRTSTNFTSHFDEHVRAIENQFITDYRTDLEALRAAAEQRR